MRRSRARSSPEDTGVAEWGLPENLSSARLCLAAAAEAAAAATAAPCWGLSGARRPRKKPPSLALRHSMSSRTPESVCGKVLWRLIHVGLRPASRLSCVKWERKIGARWGRAARSCAGSVEQNGWTTILLLLPLLLSTRPTDSLHSHSRRLYPEGQSGDRNYHKPGAHGSGYARTHTHIHTRKHTHIHWHTYGERHTNRDTRHTRTHTQQLRWNSRAGIDDVSTAENEAENAAKTTATELTSICIV